MTSGLLRSRKPSRLMHTRSTLPFALVATVAHTASAQPDARTCLAASHASVEAIERHDDIVEYEQLSVCANESCPSLVHEECQRRLQVVAQRVTVVRFMFSNLSHSERQGVRVSVDGKPEAPYSEGAALALGAGHHELVFRSGSAEVTRAIDAAGKGDNLELQLEWPRLATRAELSDAQLPTESNAHPWDATKTTALVLGGIGVASLAVAGGYTLSALAKRERAARSCPDVCSSVRDAERWDAAVDAGNTASVWATVGWLGFTAGGALLAFAFYSDGTRQPAIALGVGPSSVAVGGQF